MRRCRRPTHNRNSKIWTLSPRAMKVRGMRWTCFKTISIFMPGRTRPRAASRPHRKNGSFGTAWLRDLPRHWLALGAALWGFGAMGQTSGQPPAPAPPAEPPASRAPPPAQRPADTPDDELIEFLGEDDHGDTAWWEFLKKT